MRVALITGAARGIGRACAARLVRDGWRVWIVDRDGDAASRAAAALDGTRPLELDVTDAKAAGVAVARIEDEEGRIDALVNNAGVLRDAPLVEMTDEDFRAVIDVCLFGSFSLSRAVVPTMIRQGRGRIVNISSRAYLGNPGQSNYSSAKAGVVGLTKALAKELGRHGITVNAVAPGVVETEMVQAHPRAEMIIERAAKANSIPRVGTPDEIAAAVAYLCSDDAGYITGDVLHLSGGRFG